MPFGGGIYQDFDLNLLNPLPVFVYFKIEYVNPESYSRITKSKGTQTIIDPKTRLWTMDRQGPSPQDLARLGHSDERKRPHKTQGPVFGGWSHQHSGRSDEYYHCSVISLQSHNVIIMIVRSSLAFVDLYFLYLCGSILSTAWYIVSHSSIPTFSGTSKYPSVNSSIV